MTWIIHRAPIPANWSWDNGSWVSGDLLAVTGLVCAGALVALVWRERRRRKSPGRAREESRVESSHGRQIPRAAA